MPTFAFHGNCSKTRRDFNYLEGEEHNVDTEGRAKHQRSRLIQLHFSLFTYSHFLVQLFVMAHIRDETSFEDESSDNRDDEKLLSEDTQLDYGRQKGKSRVIVLSLAFGIITNLLWTLLLTVLTWKTLYQSTTYSSSGPALSERPNLICCKYISILLDF